MSDIKYNLTKIIFIILIIMQERGLKKKTSRLTLIDKCISFFQVYLAYRLKQHIFKTIRIWLRGICSLFREWYSSGQQRHTETGVLFLVRNLQHLPLFKFLEHGAAELGWRHADHHTSALQSSNLLFGSSLPSCNNGPSMSHSPARGGSQTSNK